MARIPSVLRKYFISHSFLTYLVGYEFWSRPVGVTLKGMCFPFRVECVQLKPDCKDYWTCSRFGRCPAREKAGVKGRGPLSSISRCQEWPNSRQGPET